MTYRFVVYFQDQGNVMHLYLYLQPERKSQNEMTQIGTIQRIHEIVPTLSVYNP